jgi:hypothetical protein
MNQLELSKRKQRAEAEPLVITKTSEGYRIFSAANPSKFYLVREVDGRISCNCLDFEKHSLDPTWRCKHVLAIDKSEEDEERKAIQAEAKGESLPRSVDEFLAEPTPHSRLLIKRSISPDGRIDSVSLELHLELNGEPPAVIKARATDALRLEAEIASVFVASRQLEKEMNGNKKPSESANLPQPNGSVLEATLRDIGVMPGKWGPRHFINVDVMGRVAKLFGTPKQIAAAIKFAGYYFPPESVAEGVDLNMPCRVTTKQNGQYLNIERVFPIR